MMTNHEAKLYLAEKLPEMIGNINDCYVWMESFSNGTKLYGKVILETEWEQIRLWVEEKMNTAEYFTYIQKLAGDCDWKELTRKIVSATYATRATAMKESGL
jgi:hypothetical protein